MDKNIGAMLDGRYEIKKRIGVGGMADVYKAYDVEECREVAVKVLRNEFIDNDEFLQRFKNESKAVSMLSHPNIVKVLDVGFNDDIRYIVMEYIDGITLKEYIDQQGRLDWKETVHLVTQILRALQHAHDRGIIHRDIKPQNIMMFMDGSIKVMDFGIAKFTYELGITATAQTIGSVHYISPEQASGKTTDGKSDIYSVGILMYEMLTGKKPFDTDNPVTVAIMQMNDTAEKPRSVNPDIPEGMEEIILKAIEKNPADRYQSARDMIKDIERFKNDPDIVFGYYSNDNFDDSSYDEYGDLYDDSLQDNNNSIYDIPQQQDEYSDDQNDDVNYYIGNKKHDQSQYDEFEDENYEIDEKAEKSPLVKVFTVGTVIAIIAIVFGIVGLINHIRNGSDMLEMPRLIQYNIEDMQNKYKGDLDIVVDGDPIYSEFAENAIVEQSIDEGTKVSKGSVVHVKISNGKNTSTVPDVSGKTADEAVDMINKMGFKVEQIKIFDDKIEYNMVVRVDPEAGTEMEISNIVTLYVSKGAQNDAKPVPNVLGKKKAEAENLLREAGFKVSVEEKDDKAEKDVVIFQSVPADTLMNPSEKIIIHVSTGKAPSATVPLTIVFPERAIGEFTFNIYLDDEFSFAKTDVNVEVAKNMKFDISGSEKKTVKIELENVATQAKVILGTYAFDFENKKHEVITENILGAFEALGGIKPEETVPPATAPPQQPVDPPPVHTNPPVQVPPQTNPPEPQEPVVTDAPPTDQPQEPNLDNSSSPSGSE